MKVSYQWLNQYLPLEEKGIQPAALAEKLARTSVDINDVYSPMDGLKKLVVGLVVACEPHPDSDHLNVCQVQVSETETLQIVCGAPNVQVGKKVIVALVGARIKDNIKIKRARSGALSPMGCCVPYKKLASASKWRQRIMKPGFGSYQMMLLSGTPSTRT